MSHVTIIQHVEPEGPGAIADALQARGLERHLIRVHEGQPLPVSIHGMAGLVVLGGPMGVHDTHRHRHLRDAMRLIEMALEARRPVLGVCLGSQMLAQALGSEVRAGARREIGWHTVTLSEEAPRDTLFSGVERTFDAFHWHGDIFDLPAGAVSLASSLATPCQAFRWREDAYGLLFHLEVDAAAVRRMVRAFGKALGETGIEPGHILDSSNRHLSALRRIGNIVFGRWAGLIERQPGVKRDDGSLITGDGS